MWTYALNGRLFIEHYYLLCWYYNEKCQQCQKMLFFFFFMCLPYHKNNDYYFFLLFVCIHVWIGYRLINISSSTMCPVKFHIVTRRELNTGMNSSITNIRNRTLVWAIVVMSILNITVCTNFCWRTEIAMRWTLPELRLSPRMIWWVYWLYYNISKWTLFIPINFTVTIH